MATSGAVVLCTIDKKNEVPSNRSLEDDAKAKVLLFEDSENAMIPSDSSLIGSYMECTRNKKIIKMKWFCQIRHSPPPGMCDILYHTLQQYHIFQLVSCENLLNLRKFRRK
jgi:hypothetical protein